MKTWITGAALAAGLSTGAYAVPVTVDSFDAISGGAETLAGLLTAPSGIDWYSFDVAAGATYVDIYTSNTAFDSEIGLYAADGMLIASDDDDGFGSDSALSFGTGSGVQIGIVGFTDGGGPFVGSGQDGGMLAPGEYFVSVSAFSTVFSDDFGVNAFNQNASGAYNLTIKSDVAAVPLPAGLPLMALALAGVGALGYRRKSA